MTPSAALRSSRLLAIPVIAAAVVAVPLITAGQPAEAGSGQSKADKARGLEFAGLVKQTSGKYAGKWRIDVAGAALYTHGPDPAPRDIDVTTALDFTGTTTQSVSPATVPCIGDGTSGQRIQVVYAVASDKADNYAAAVSTISSIAGQMDAALNDSARVTGGERHFRFVTKADCSLDVAKVVLSPTGDDTFANTISELQTKGFTSNSRKYLVMADAAVYCGIAQVYEDDSAGATNLSNTRTGYARVDRGCWGRTDHLSELHETMHMLGSVQPSAPHATANLHCTDESDAMCYPDAAGVTMTYTCPSSEEWFLDCGKDDYFNTNPAAGSYLATHWNTANSGFLATSLTDTGTPVAPVAPTTVVESYIGSVSSKKPTVWFAVTTGAGSSATDLSFTASGRTKTPPTLRLRVISSTGTVVASATGPSILKLAASLQSDTYKFEVTGTTSVSFKLSVTHVVA